jgi:hypothetical protein
MGLKSEHWINRTHTMFITLGKVQGMRKIKLNPAANI